MARARNIKPGICKNEDLAACSIAARYLFACLPMWADREGRLEDRPLRLKIEIFPADAVDVDGLLNELASHGTPPFVVRYQNSGGRFIQITRFDVHQSPHYSEKPSVIKPPPLRESTVHDDSSTPGNSSPPSTTIPGVLPENSGSDPPIKRGVQPPDSLILRFSDSPIPDSGKERVGSAPKNGARHASQDASPLVVSLPMRDGSEFPVRQSLVTELEPLYPAVDVPQTLREMRGWLLGNPDRRKTTKGARRFITSWLHSEQEKHGG